MILHRIHAGRPRGCGYVHRCGSRLHRRIGAVFPPWSSEDPRPADTRNPVDFHPTAGDARRPGQLSAFSDRQHFRRTLGQTPEVRPCPYRQTPGGGHPRHSSMSLLLLSPNTFHLVRPFLRFLLPAVLSVVRQIPETVLPHEQTDSADRVVPSGQAAQCCLDPLARYSRPPHDPEDFRPQSVGSCSSCSMPPGGDSPVDIRMRLRRLTKSSSLHLRQTCSAQSRSARIFRTGYSGTMTDTGPLARSVHPGSRPFHGTTRWCP